MQGLMISDTEVKIGYFTQTEKELIHASLERLFFTELNSQVGSIDQGSRILDYFFMPATENSANSIMEEVKFLVGTYEPRIVLDAIGVDLVPSNGTIGLVILCEFHAPENPEKKDILEFVKVREIG